MPDILNYQTVAAKIVTPSTTIEFPTEEEEQQYITIHSKESGEDQQFSIPDVDVGTYEFYLVSGFEFTSRG